MSKSLKIAGSIVLCLLVGFIGSLFTTPAIPTWYEGLIKPFFSPPNWIFAPMWTILYILMGISLYLVWEKSEKGKKRDEALKMFSKQLALNAIWSPIFFGAKTLGLAFLVIVLMWIAIFETIKAFNKVNNIAGKLLYPYLAWVSFASLLNFSVWILNK